MKRIAEKFYHFLGGIYFAIFLIASTAIFVITGTFIESITESHRYAALFTYSSPLFSALLCGFFINILISALRRWPFKYRHIPFLITHLGMLMILTGVLVKIYFGTQGSMGIMEGSATDEIFLADSYSLYIETREPPTREFIPIPKNFPLNAKLPFDKMDIVLQNFTPHAFERMETWIKGKNHISIMGVPPIPLESPISIKLNDDSSWKIHGLISNTPAEKAKETFKRSTKVLIKDSLLDKVYFDGPFDQLELGIETTEGLIKGELQWEWSSISGFPAPPQINLELNQQEYKEKIAIALQGDQALKNNNLKSGLGKARITVDLITEPSILFIQGKQDDLFLFAFDSYGRVFSDTIQQDNLSSLYIYDEGFGGYSALAKIPFKAKSMGRKDLEIAHLNAAAAILSEGLKQPSELSPPLQLIQDACKKSQSDFVQTTIDFIDYWDKTGSWLFPLDVALPESLDKVFSLIDWKSHHNSIYKGCWWNSRLFDRLEPHLKMNEDLLAALEEGQWPLISSLKLNNHFKDTCPPNEWLPILTMMTQQVFGASEMLPEAPESISSVQNARLITAFLRASEIHPSAILDSMPEANLGTVQLECSLAASHIPGAPSKKLEDNTPGIIVKLIQGNRKSVISLGYDRFGTGMKWPALQGNALVRFQPIFNKIPYRIRLREARQINYPNSQQPYSFESDLIIKDLRDNSETEKTISMNNVYETWDGYRFYLANIYPPNEGAVKRVQIAVNHDPAKYYLTYPGAIIMTLGILLLFWLQPYRTR